VKYLNYKLKSKNGSVKNKNEERGRNEKCKGSLNTYVYFQEHSTIENNGK